MAEEDENRFEKALAGLPTRVTLTYASFKPGPPSESKDPVQLAIDEPPPEEVVVCLQFSEAGFGFGEVAIRQTSEGVFLDTEHMSVERVKRYFAALFDSAITDTETDPARHKLYNKVMRSECGEVCEICFPKAP